MNTPRGTFFALASSFTIVAASPQEAFASAGAAGPMEKRISIHVEGVRVGNFIDVLSEQARMNLLLDPGLEEERVSVQLQNLPVDDVLSALDEARGLRVHAIPGTTVGLLSKRAAPPQAPNPIVGGKELEGKLTVRVKEGTLGSFLSVLSKQTKLSFVLAEGVGEEKVTAFLKEMTVREILESVSAVYGLEFRRGRSARAYSVKRRF